MPDSSGSNAAGGTPGRDGTSGQRDDDQQQQGQQQQRAGGTPAGQGDRRDGTSGDDSQQQQGQDRDDAGLRSALQREREANREMRERLKALEEKDLPEADRRARRLAELEGNVPTMQTRIRDLEVDNRAILLAGRLGFADPDDALGWLARNRTQIQFDDATNAPTNLEPLLKGLLRAKPHLATRTGAGAGDQGDRNGTGGADQGARGDVPEDMNARIRRLSGR